MFVPGLDGILQLCLKSAEAETPASSPFFHPLGVNLNLIVQGEIHVLGNRIEERMNNKGREYISFLFRKVLRNWS